LIGVAICTANQHVMLCTKEGKALRFPVTTLRIFKSRASDGVRGIKLAKANDAVVSMTILSESAISIDKREELLNLPLDLRMNIATTSSFDPTIMDATKLQYLSLDEALSLSKAEQFILSVTEKGYGKRTSAYEYRITGRGGQGVLNIDTSTRNGPVVASFPINHTDEIILITNAGTLIRTKVADIRITGRNAMGVRIINLKDNEKVISVSRIVGSDTEIEMLDNDQVTEENTEE
jgi:DNA gyrase subunit A